MTAEGAERTAEQRWQVVVHADEACLGNGMEPPTPGGAGGLVELTRGAGASEHRGTEVIRRDYFVSEPDTTNNRMALASAIVALELLGAKGKSLRIAFVSDSNYLVQGMREWVAAWRARGWRRKGGPVENLALWQRLDELARRHRVSWRWVRGHAGDPRNEYADHLAQRAARDQLDSGGLVESGFEAWLAARKASSYLSCPPPRPRSRS